LVHADQNFVAAAMSFDSNGWYQTEVWNWLWKLVLSNVRKKLNKQDANVTKVHSNLRFHCILEPSVENNRLVAQLETFCAKSNGMKL